MVVVVAAVVVVAINSLFNASQQSHKYSFTEASIESQVKAIGQALEHTVMQARLE